MVVFYDVDYEYLTKWVFNPLGLKTIIRNPSKIVLNPILIFYIIPNLKLFRFNNMLHRLRIIYEMSVLDYYSPIIVFTYVDNNALFKNISKIDNKRKYFALQNGTRFDWVINAVGKSKIKKTMNKMNYLSLGEYEKDLFKEYGDYNCNVVPVGSFRMSINNHYDNEVKNKYNICIVSTMINFSENCELANQKIDRARLLYNVNDNEFYLMWKKLSQHLRKYIQEKNLSVIIPLRYENNEFEKEFFYKRFNDIGTIKERTKFGTYHAMNNSEIIVSIGCTTLLEAMGLGKKIMQIDYSKSHHWTGYYKDTITNLNDDSYESFEKKMNYLFSISTNQYQNEINNYSKYLIKYNSKSPTYELIKNELKRYL